MGNASFICAEGGNGANVGSLYVDTIQVPEELHQSARVAAKAAAEEANQTALEVADEVAKAGKTEDAVAKTEAEAVTPTVHKSDTMVPAVQEKEEVLSLEACCDDAVTTTITTETSLRSESTHSASIVGETYTSRKECEFFIQLTRKDALQPWGLKLTPANDGSMVTIKVPAGPSIARWLAANPDMGVRQADEIISVNEVACNGDLQNIWSELNAPHQVADVGLRRQLAFSARIMCTGKLGIKLSEDSLDVMKIREEGDVMEYNKRSSPNVQICVGDTLMQVGDVRVTKHNLADELKRFKEGDSVELVIQRPAPGSFVQNPSIPASLGHPRRVQRLSQLASSQSGGAPCDQGFNLLLWGATHDFKCLHQVLK